MVEDGDADEHVAGALAVAARRATPPRTPRSTPTKSPRQASASQRISPPRPVGSTSSIASISSAHACSCAGSVAPDADTISAQQHGARGAGRRRTARAAAGRRRRGRGGRAGRTATGGPHSRAASSPERSAAAQQHGVAPVVGLPLEADRVALDARRCRVGERQVGERGHPVGERRQRRSALAAARRAARGRRPAPSPASGSARRAAWASGVSMLLCTSEATWSVAVGRVDAERAGDVVGGVELEAAGEHGQPAEQPLLVGVEQAVRPLDRGPHGAVAVVARRRPPSSRPSRSSRAPTMAATPSVAVAGRGQLDGQRDAVEPPAQLVDRSSVERAPRSAPAAAARCWNSSTAVVAGSSERTGQHVLAVDARAPRGWWRRPTGRGTPRSARRSTAAARSTTCSQLSTTSSVRVAGRAAAAAAASGSATPTAPDRCRAIASATSSGSATLASSTNHTLANSRQQLGGGVHGEAGLADAADAGQRHDAVAPGSWRRAAGHVEVAADQRRALGRQVVGVACRRRGPAGTAGASSGWTTCHSRSGSARSRSRWVPRSASADRARARCARARRRRRRAGSGRRGRRP